MTKLWRSSIQHELDEFFKQLLGKNLSERQVTDSAFCQARQKINPGVFLRINQIVSDYFYQNTICKKWKDHRLVGIDGSKINLPYSESVAANFHPQTDSAKGKVVYMANVSQAFDLLNHIVLDATVSSIKGSEGSEINQALGHLSKLQSGDLILADRGYPGFLTFSAILDQSLDFCIRLTKASFQEAQDFRLSKQQDSIVEISIRNKDVRSKCRKLGYPIVPIRIRLVKIKLKSGETEILATSLLDSKKYPKSSFKTLYGLRWNIEESYKRLKHRIDIENFTGKSYTAILQDFNAKILATNLISVMIYQPEKRSKVKRKYSYKVNWSHAIRKFRTVCITLFNQECNIDMIAEIIALLIDQKVPIRKNRSNPRVHRPHASRDFPAYKP